MVNRLNLKSINHSNNLLIKVQEKKKVINHIEQMNKEYSIMINTSITNSIRYLTLLNI